MRVKKECNREEERERSSASREGVRVEKECKLRRSETRERV